MKWQLALAIWLGVNGLILLRQAWSNRKKQGEELVVTVCVIVGTALLALSGGLLL